MENVVGLKAQDSSSDKSPLAWIETELAEAGYEVSTNEVDMGSFHRVTRKRWADSKKTQR